MDLLNKTLKTQIFVKIANFTTDLLCDFTVDKEEILGYTVVER